MDLSDETLMRYLDGRLDERAEAALREAACRDPALAARLLHIAEDDVMLREAMQVQAEAHEPRAAPAEEREGDVSLKLPAGPRVECKVSVRRSPSQAWSSIGPYLALAAGVLLVFGTWMVLSNKPTRPVPMTEQVAAGDSQPTQATQREVSGFAFRVSRPETRNPELETRNLEVVPLRPKAIPPVPPERQPGRQGTVALGKAPEAGPQTPAGASRAGPDESLQETARALVSLAQIEGRVMYARGWQGQWVSAVEGISLLPGDRLDTRVGRVRLECKGGTVYVNRNTVLRMLAATTGAGEAVLVSLSRGEVFVEEVATPKVHVETPDGLFSPVGTRFDVMRRLSATVVTVETGAVEARTRPQGSSPAGPADGAKNRQAVRVDLRRLAWVTKAVRVGAGFQMRVRKGIPPAGPRKAVKTADSWGWRAGIALHEEILLLPRMGRIVGDDWRLVKDPGASTGFALEAPEEFAGWMEADELARKVRSHHVLFTFRADANTEYHIWIRGNCTAKRKRVVHDAVALKLYGATLNKQRATSYGNHKSMVDFNGYSHRPGYWWIGGEGDRARDEVPVSVRFARSGRQRLKLLISETPMRIDAIWLSATQKTRPAPDRYGPGPERP